MSSEAVVRAEHLGKRYRLGRGVGDHTLLTEAITNVVRAPLRRLLGHKRTPPEYVWALKDVSLEVRGGEALGIVGRNGAGKSTLLKILSRITEPTEGTATLVGRVGSLLEVGTGFHPELTGRENIFLNGAILGMRRAEIERKFDEIVAFAEIDRFVETPVKRYSSGMYVRLAFAVAAHLDPEILIVDEVLAVGDAAFQRKCLGTMGDVARRGRTVLFVSHNMRAVTDLCDRCVWLDEGRIQKEGHPQEVVLAYLEASQPAVGEGAITPEMHKGATGEISFTGVALLDRSERPVPRSYFGRPLSLRLEMDVSRRLEGVRIGLGIETLDGTLVTVLHHPESADGAPLDLDPGSYVATVRSDVLLMPGAYAVQLFAKHVPGYWGWGPSLDWVPRALVFHVEEFSDEGRPVLPSGAMVYPPSEWRVAPRT